MVSKKIKVLIVDDSLVFVNFLSKELPHADKNIEIVGYAMNAADAMRKIPSTKPDVITLDVEMPRTNGIDFLKELLPNREKPYVRFCGGRLLTQADGRRYQTRIQMWKKRESLRSDAGWGSDAAIFIKMDSDPASKAKVHIQQKNGLKFQIV